MQTAQISDNELIVSYLQGNESALSELVKRHKRKIFTSIYMLVRNRELAEDIFQDTFIKVINTLKAGNYHEEGKFLPWVSRIAHNLVIDHFRKQKRMPLSHDTEEYSIMDNIRFKDDNVQDRMIKQQIHDHVKQLIEELPDEQREVVLMRIYGNLSFKEIAEATNVSINTSLGRMRYALINLRRIIKEHNIVLTN
ncbi:MAG TPA: sigma-70 family RNA polymerase sigma factor [Bacteroidia bacterium]|nr:sigma-70 family RNA polymerase sigma factor [Bacteroidia bacterium]HNT80169.1 sigma-70 family RNA polymerase sigma factor [Bacteroidia bacterium]